MTTLESRYEKRISSLIGTDAEVEYMLDAMPFIREYMAEHTQQSGGEGATESKAMDGFVTISRKGNKHAVYQQYLEHVEKDFAAAQARPLKGDGVLQKAWACSSCVVTLILNERESLLVCPQCGCTQVFTDTQALTYDQEIEQTTKVVTFAYKRMNHFTEWLNTLQGKENTEIPVEVLEAVRAEFKKERACKRSDVTPDKVHAFLKKLRLNKFYDNKYAICNAVSGVAPPQLPQHLEDRLKQMFNDIQEPFEKHKPSTRKNFLSYGYVLSKFCQLLGEDGIQKFFPLLKSPEKLRAQDEIWRKICAELGWEYIPSI